MQSVKRQRTIVRSAQYKQLVAEKKTEDAAKKYEQLYRHESTKKANQIGASEIGEID